MQDNSVCLFLPKLLVNNRKCKHLSHGPDLAGGEPPLGRRGAILPRCIFAFSDGGEWAEAFKQNVFRGLRFEDFMFANDLQVHT